MEGLQLQIKKHSELPLLDSRKYSTYRRYILKDYTQQTNACGASPRRNFLQQSEYTKQPVDLMQLVYHALINVAGRDRLESGILSALKKAPKYNEFRAALTDAINHAFAGMTECSYNQLKHLPDDLLGNTYVRLRACWDRKLYQSEWK